jgi:hypothetical protein
VAWQDTAGDWSRIALPSEFWRFAVLAVFRPRPRVIQRCNGKWKTLLIAPERMGRLSASMSWGGAETANEAHRRPVDVPALTGTPPWTIGSARLFGANRSQLPFDRYLAIQRFVVRGELKRVL